MTSNLAAWHNHPLKPAEVSACKLRKYSQEQTTETMNSWPLAKLVQWKATLTMTTTKIIKLSSKSRKLSSQDKPSAPMSNKSERIKLRVIRRRFRRIRALLTMSTMFLSKSLRTNVVRLREVRWR